MSGVEPAGGYLGGPHLRWRESGRDAGRVVVDVAGQLDIVPEVERFKHFMEERYVDDGVNHITLNLRGVRFVNLEGIGVLLALWKESRDRGKRFDIARASAQVRAKLRITGVLEMLEED
jgi:anti-anti-sigma factor